MVPCACVDACTALSCGPPRTRGLFGAQVMSDRASHWGESYAYHQHPQSLSSCVPSFLVQVAFFLGSVLVGLRVTSLSYFQLRVAWVHRLGLACLARW